MTLAQVIGCLFVILGHSYPFLTPMPSVVVSVQKFIYVFHMPLFVFCSGFLFAYSRQTERKSFAQFIQQRAKKLLIPYFILSLIGILPKYLFSSVLNDSLQLDYISLIRTIFVPRENIWGHFWFIPMIFLMGCVSYLVDKRLTRRMSQILGWGILSVVLISLAAVWNNTEAMQWLGVNDLVKFGWCYSLGITLFYICGDLKERIHVNKYSLILISVIAASISILLWIIVGYGTARFIVSVLMILSVLTLSLSCDDMVNVNRSSLIAQTYQIYILSWPCQLVAEIILERLLHVPWWIIIPSVLCAGVVVPLIIIKHIQIFEKRTDTYFLSLIVGK